MKIDNPADLEKLVKLCRKLGVESIEVDGVKLALKDAPKRNRKAKGTDEIETEEMSDEDLMMWSVRG